jgi:catechol 2,3-dioxygenase-like lactoylglutathione lyase family enzyme
MALTSLYDLELAVPDPAELEAFWIRRGMRTTGPGTLGTDDRASQLRFREGGYRHVSEVRLACNSESDLDDIVQRLDTLGVTAHRDGSTVRCSDPVLDHDVVIGATGASPLTPPPSRQLNGPGRSDRSGRRSSVAVADTAPVPRRVGHVVFGTTDMAASLAFYRDGLGMRVSDSLGDGIGYFLRCSPDHHNVLLMPAPVPCLNHYAVELDDVDAIGRAGHAVVRERPDASVYGLGRHVLGSNLFWYLLDPAGGMFELFADMDQIVDDEAWETEQRRDDWDPFTIASWEPGPAKPDFFLPADIDVIAKGREAAGR